MEIDNVQGDPDFPRKLLDKKVYVRLNPDTGELQLVRVEPHIENGNLMAGNVLVTIDESAPMLMEREVAATFIEQQKCVPLGEFSDWKSKGAN